MTPKVVGLLDHVKLSVPYTEAFANIYVCRLLCIALRRRQRYIILDPKLRQSRLLPSFARYRRNDSAPGFFRRHRLSCCMFSAPGFFRRHRLSCCMFSWHFAIKKLLWAHTGIGKSAIKTCNSNQDSNHNSSQSHRSARGSTHLQ